MKKALLKILCVALIVCALFTATACSNGSWQGTNMKNWGAVKEMGGFVAETENYYYVINGAGVSTDDNAFGTPVKGALVAVDKKDLTKSEIVVPKLFVASDYNAGLFIDGDYVYYGTPSTDKTAEGTVANTELHFMRTKLDGTDTKEFFKLSGLSSEYRIVKGGDTVYIVYYDSAETELVAYDTASGNKTVIAKTDAKTDKLYSLANYKFVADAESDVVVFYTTTVYAEEYIEDKVDSGMYARATESYTNLYAYKAGDKVDEAKGLAGTLIGNATGSTYEIKLAKAYTFYTETDVNTSTAKTYGDTAKNILANKKGVEIKNDSYIADTNIIISLDEVYTLSENKVYRSTLTGDDKLAKQLVASQTSISSIVAIEDGQLYYVNSANKLAKVELGKADAKEIVLTQGTVLTSWYKAEIFAGKLFYLDNSATGVSYVKCVDLTATVTEEDTNDDGEADSFYIDKETAIGVMSDSDKAAKVSAEITAIANDLQNGVLPFEKKDGVLTVTAVTEARKAYDALPEGAKNEFDETSLSTLKNYEKAIEMANVYAQLDGMYGYTNLKESERVALENKYNEIKPTIEEFMKSDDYQTVSALIENNLKWNYQRAVEIFTVD